MIFNDNSKSILKIKLKKITISEDIFELYNNIIRKYKLNKPLFDTENFDLEDFYDFTDIIEIIKIICNNILIKIKSVNMKVSQKETFTFLFKFCKLL